jgi:hypothetical protein
MRANLRAMLAERGHGMRTDGQIATSVPRQERLRSAPVFSPVLNGPSSAHYNKVFFFNWVEARLTHCNERCFHAYVHQRTARNHLSC